MSSSTMESANTLEALRRHIHSAADVADSNRKARRTVEGLDATLVTGHDPEEWPKFKKAPEYYT